MKAPLGCLAFLAGAGVVGVLFLPPAIGKWVRFLEERFERTRAGTLELKGAWVGSFYGENRIESVVLRDPEGHEVLHGELSAPALWRVGEGEVFGPVVLALDRVDLRRDAGGELNLSRAFRSRDGARLDWSLGDLEADLESSGVRFDVLVDRLTWSDAAGRSFELEDVFGGVTVQDEGRRLALHTEGRGTVAGLPGGPDATGAPRGTFDFEARIEDIGRDFDVSPWWLRFDAGPSPSVLLLALLGADADVEAIFGPSVDSIALTMSAGAAEPARLHLTVKGGASLQLSASAPRRSDFLLAEPEDTCLIEFSADSAWMRQVVARILPLTEDLRFPDTGRATVQLSRYALPLDGDLARLRGRGTFVVDDLSYALRAPFRERFRSAGRERLVKPVTVFFAEGLVHYERFGLPAGTTMLSLDGSMEPREPSYELTVAQPGGHTVRISGAPGALEVEKLHER